MSPLLLISVFLFTSVTCVDNSVLVDGSNEFGYDLSAELYTDSSTNIWISPFCISSCFALIYAGSNGNTQTQIANVFGYPSNKEEVTQQFFTLQSLIENTYNGIRHNYNQASIIGIANKIYSSQSLTLKQTYIDALNDGKQSFIDYNFDFSANNATTIINKWVNQNTNGLIQNIIDENADISSWRLVAINAIYLNGTFQKQFDAQMTSLSKFYPNPSRNTETETDTQNTNINCHLMHQIDYFQYYSNDNYQFLKFPFSDLNDLFVLFVLPINNDISAQQNALITDEDIIKTALNNLESKYIALALPKLSITATYTLNQQLKDLDMTDAFDGATADFSDISDAGLYIDTVIHKTMVEMDENGLVAAAVTLIAMNELAAIETTRPTPILFKADHAFQMFIIDGEHEDTILFMGQINNPGIVEGAETPFDESSDPVWTNYDLINDNVSGPRSDELNRDSLIVVVVAVCVVIIAVLVWFFLGRRQQKEIYIEKISSKNFVELKATNDKVAQNHVVEVAKEEDDIEVELGDTLQNSLR